MKLSYWQKLLYSAGSLGVALSYQAFAAYIQFLYIDQLGLKAQLVGIGWAVYGVWNAINDPLAGYWSDRTRTRVGRRIPWILAGFIPVGLFFYLLWVPPAPLLTGADAPSPHATGAAVDLTIRWEGGDPLWMGSLFDDASPLAHTARFDTETGAEAFSFSNEEARANRRLLYWLMVDAGFASNPSEWWHFSFGDQMWAKLRNEPEALYAGAEPAQ
jgi:hypothetical protein